MVSLRLVFNERVYILSGCKSPYSTNGNRQRKCDDRRIALSCCRAYTKTGGKGRCRKSNRKVVDTVEREDYDNNRILLFGIKSDKF